jgi:DNA-binding winged helix-turn-helix (wHTH) protein
VTKQQLLDDVWPDTFVSNAVLKDCIRQLREALQDDAKSPTYIETAHRRGYRFIAAVVESAKQPVSTQTHAVAAVLSFTPYRQPTPVTTGEVNVLDRAPTDFDRPDRDGFGHAISITAEMAAT